MAYVCPRIAERQIRLNVGRGVGGIELRALRYARFTPRYVRACMCALGVGGLIWSCWLEGILPKEACAKVAVCIHCGMYVCALTCTRVCVCVCELLNQKATC